MNNLVKRVSNIARKASLYALYTKRTGGGRGGGGGGGGEFTVRTLPFWYRDRQN